METVYKGARLLNFANYHKLKIPSPITRRKITYADITFLFEGELHYKLNDEYIRLKAGDAIIFPTGSVRERLKTDKYARYASFNVIFPDGVESSLSGKIKNAVDSSTSLLIDRIEEDLKYLSSRSSDKCLSIFFYLYYRLSESAESNENPHYKNIKQYIYAHLAEKITLSDIAESCHLVERYICTLFKKHSGRTLTEYITKERVKLAKRLIVTSDLSLFEIASACGFSDYNYFSRSFKKIVGMTATAYKKTKRAMS